jgi:hypothetical protein
MSVRAKTTVARGLALVLVASGAWVVGHLAAATAEGPPPPTPVEITYTEKQYEGATERIAGRLAPWAHQALRSEGAGAGSTMLFLVRDRDRRSCEDLARQLRELRRSAPAELRMVVWTGKGDTGPIEAFLRQERIRVEAVQGVEIDSVFGAGTRVVTPTTLVVAPDGLARGVAHTRRFPGTRPRSFAAELGFSH